MPHPHRTGHTLHRFRRLCYLVALMALFTSVLPANADPYPPYWGGGTGPAVHFAPVAWPGDAAWTPYTSESANIADPRTSDPSNGGTAPQNYVNVSSGCIDKTLPSVLYQFDAASNTAFFRWRVEQIANTYATGPSAGSFSSSDPWNSAQWTVLIDTNGDGYRDFAVHLDGSTGSPAKAIDRLVGIYAATPSQSLDYVSDPNIHELAHNPTAFIDQATSHILNYQNSLTPTPSWPNGSSETLWDYGTTRSTQILKTPSCSEYFIDYQIPLGLLDATAVGGPKITANTPIAFFFTTANSLQNPLQKDGALNGDTVFIADPSKPVPYGDTITFGGGTNPQPIVQSIRSSGCGPTTLSAQVNDTLIVNAGTTVTSVKGADFYSYFDRNANGLADDAENWIFAASGATTNNPLGTWTASWNSSSLLQGQYLIGVKAIDGQGNITWSYLTQAEVNVQIGATPPNYANPSSPGVVYSTFLNTCGAPPPSITKTATQLVPGQTQFTITLSNPTGSAITLSQVQDLLPAGFTYMSTDGGTLGSPTASPTGGAIGTIAWTFAPSVSIPASSSRTLIFTASDPTVAGTYANVATGDTSAGTLTSEPVQVGVGAPRLTIAKSASVASANPGDPIVYTITYANDSPVNMTGTTISDLLPAGLTFVSGTSGATYTSATRTITWNIGAIAAGDGPFSVSFSATVDSPYPSTASIPLVNTATIDSNQASPASASASTFINAPRPALAIQKDANLAQVAAGGQATFTIMYANTGNVAATGVSIADPIPTGFTFVSATGGGTNTSGTVTWNIGTLAAGATGSVQVTLQAANPYTAANPATNTATVSATNATPASESYQVGVTQTSLVCNTYYFHNETANVGLGADGGVQHVANTTAPLAGDTGTGTSVTVPINQALVEAVRFYQDPAPSSTINFAGNINTNIYIDRQSGPGITIHGTVYDYNPTTGTKTSLGSNSTSFGGNVNGLFSFSVLANGTLPQGHRLLWIFDASSNVNNQTANLLFQYDGNVTNSVSGSGTTFANSRADYCTTAPANLVLDKQVDSLSIQPSGTLQYTIRFANTGQTNATGAQIVDTLPSGVTFNSATMNLTSVTPAAVSGQQYTFNLHSMDTATAGQVTGGQSGVLVINVTVDQPLAAGIVSLLNSAILQSNETSPVTDTAATTVLRPDVTVSKSADKTLLIPGDIVTYAITVLNSGAATATNVTVADTLPATAYFTYVAGSAKLNGAPAAPDPVTGNLLNINIGSLTTGASATVSFQMQVASTGVPDGVTALSNTASVSDAQTIGSRSSDPVVLSISTNPNLRLVKTTSPAPGPVQAGGAVVYTLTLSNIGSSDALDVLVQDPIPTNSHFVASTLVYDGTPQTDIADGDIAHFDAVGNRAVYQVGTLPSGGLRTLQFTVRVDSPLLSGTTTINNVATVSASNSASKQGSAAIDATAAPNLTLSKSGPSMRPYPLTTLFSSASATTSISVASVAFLAVGDVISINSTTVAVTAISNNQLTLSAPVTGAAGAQVIPTYEYVLSYANTGNADATNVVVQDSLPVGLTFISADNSGTFALGIVTWNLGAVAAGQTGGLRVRVQPNGTGSFVNSATIDSNETSSTLSNNVTTSVGGLTLTKSTTTAVVSNSATGTQASYVIALYNQLSTAATGVQVTDLLPAGFSYASTTTVGGNATRTSTQSPTLGDTQPVWGTWSIPANGDLTITFIANIASTVGATTYQNGVTATSSNAGVAPFDELGTTAEDVTVFFGAVAGTVFDDANGDGVQNVGEFGISGVSIALYATGPDGLFGTSDDVLVATKTTDIDGLYSFAGVPAGNYQVKETDPVGYTSTTTNTVAVILTTSGAPPVNFGDQKVGTVGGQVFSDLDGNGVQDLGESGLGGVTITLYNSIGAVVASTITASDGSYLFTGVTAGSYSVVETDPSGYVSTTLNTVPISVAAGGAGSASFGDNILFVGAPVLQAAKASVLGTDLNGDGATNPGDTLLYTIHITNNGTASATSVGFADTPDSNTTLVVGSVQTSSGTVTSGNTAGNTTVSVAINTLPVGVSVTISYRATINDPFPVGITSVSNQGTVTSDQLLPVSTDDPNTSALGDVTMTRITANPTAVTLVSFTATWQAKAMVVRWATAAEEQSWGFHIYRSTTDRYDDAIRVTPTMILAEGRGNNGASYSWTDTTAQFGARYTYWLVETEIGGATNRYGPATPIISPAGGQTSVWVPLIVL